MTMRLAAVAALLGWAGPAAAQGTIQLEWWYSGAPVPAGTTVAVPASATATFELFVRETGGTTLQTAKLSAFGVRGTYGTPGVLSVASTNPPDIAPDPAFEQASGAQTSGSFVQFSRATFTDVAADAAGRIRLGSVRFQTAAGGTTALTASDIPSSDDWFTGGPTFAQFDASVQAYQIFVTPVPEPAAAGLAGAAGLGAALLRRRRPGRV